MTEIHRENLVNEIEQRLGHPLSPPIRQAFLQVPRELFVTSYYQQAAPHSLTWKHVDHPAAEELYHDTPLVTRIDDRGRPTSSSSQPSVMAAQLEALNLQEPGTLLEIGLGTGYHAALMSVAMKRQGLVVSVDSEPELVETAQAHLQAMGLTSCVTATADGYQGYDLYGPYHRIIATCAVRLLPRAWIEQLIPGGLLICNVQLPLASVFLRLEKQTDEGETITGHFLPIDASYMQMRSPSQTTLSAPIDWRLTREEPQRIPLSQDIIALFHHRAFLILLHCVCPTLIKKYHGTPEQMNWHFISQREQRTEAIITLQQGALLVYGEKQNEILEHVLSCIAEYRHLFGCPDETAYLLRFNQRTQNATLIVQNHSYSFQLLH